MIFLIKLRWSDFLYKMDPLKESKELQNTHILKHIKVNFSRDLLMTFSSLSNMEHSTMDEFMG